MMNAPPRGIPGVILREAKVLGGGQGFLFESFNQEKLHTAIGGHVTFA